MSGNDQYGRRLLLLGDDAEIFSFTFLYTDALSSVYEIKRPILSYYRSHLLDIHIEKRPKRLVNYSNHSTHCSWTIPYTMLSLTCKVLVKNNLQYLEIYLELFVC